MGDAARETDQKACCSLEIGMWVQFEDEESPSQVVHIHRDNGTFAVDRGKYTGRDLPGSWVHRAKLLLLPVKP